MWLTIVNLISVLLADILSLVFFCLSVFFALVFRFALLHFVDFVDGIRGFGKQGYQCEGRLKSSLLHKDVTEYFPFRVPLQHPSKVLQVRSVQVSWQGHRFRCRLRQGQARLDLYHLHHAHFLRWVRLAAPRSGPSGSQVRKWVVNIKVMRKY